MQYNRFIQYKNIDIQKIEYNDTYLWYQNLLERSIYKNNKNIFSQKKDNSSIEDSRQNIKYISDKEKFNIQDEDTCNLHVNTKQDIRIIDKEPIFISKVSINKKDDIKYNNKQSIFIKKIK